MNIKKIRLLDLDESQNPLMSNKSLQRSQSATKTTRNNSNSKEESVSNTNLQSFVKTFFSYPMQNKCDPTAKSFKNSFSSNNDVKSAYSVYRSTKSELLDHKP